MDDDKNININIKRSRNIAVMKQHEVMDTSCSLYGGVYTGYDDVWTSKRFRKQLEIHIVKYDAYEMEFDMVGIDPSVANAFRRILLSEVPSMAIEKVFIYNNTSVIPDEVLAHRLGLIPLKADPRKFEYRQEGDIHGTEQDTLEFELKIRCSWNPRKPADSNDPDELYVNHKINSSHLKWIPIGTQAHMFRASDVGPTVGDILIDKLRPGHELDVKIHAVKGIGKDHAKFSPVATAFYRLLPDIKLTKKVEGELAEKLQKCFSPGVIKIVEKNGRKIAEVHDARYDSCSRNVLKYDELSDCVQLGRVKDHFIFTIESLGAISPDALFRESIRVLKGKCRKFLAEINRGYGDA